MELEKRAERSVKGLDTRRNLPEAETTPLPELSFRPGRQGKCSRRGREDVDRDPAFGRGVSPDESLVVLSGGEDRSAVAGEGKRIPLVLCRLAQRFGPKPAEGFLSAQDEKKRLSWRLSLSALAGGQARISNFGVSRAGYSLGAELPASREGVKAFPGLEKDRAFVSPKKFPDTDKAGKFSSRVAGGSPGLKRDSYYPGSFEAVDVDHQEVFPSENVDDTITAAVVEA